MIRLPKLKGKEIYEHRMRKIASKVSRDTGWKSQARKRDRELVRKSGRQGSDP